MKNKKITLKYKKKKYSLVVKECNFFEKILGLMVFRNQALFLFNLKKPNFFKIHSFFCSPFLAVYADDKNNIQEIIPIKSWKPSILPKNRFNKLVEIPLVKKYSHIVNQLLK